MSDVNIKSSHITIKKCKITYSSTQVIMCITCKTSIKWRYNDKRDSRVLLCNRILYYLMSYIHITIFIVQFTNGCVYQLSVRLLNGY